MTCPLAFRLRWHCEPTKLKTLNKLATAQALGTGALNRAGGRLTTAASAVRKASEIVITLHACGSKKRRAERINMDNEDAGGKVHKTIVQLPLRSRD